MILCRSSTGVPEKDKVLQYGEYTNISFKRRLGLIDSRPRTAIVASVWAFVEVWSGFSQELQTRAEAPVGRKSEQEH